MISRAFCTVVTANYVQDARALAASLAAHEPDAPLYVLVAARGPATQFLATDAESPNLRLLTLDDLAPLGDADVIDRMCFYYSAFELSQALKAWMHRYLIAFTTVQQWLYIDSDVLPCAAFEPAWRSLASRPILLTPHQTRPNAVSDDLPLLQMGLYNGGLVGLSRSPEASAFADWFASRLAVHCFARRDGLFHDQKWLDLVPLFFGSATAVSQHPGLNVAYWNLAERPLSLHADGQTVLAGGEPLIFFHFSGWDPRRPNEVSQYASIDPATLSDAWPVLTRRYMTVRNLFPRSAAIQHPFNFFNDGVEIRQAVRRAYFDDWRSGVAPAGNPFAMGPSLRHRARAVRLREATANVAAFTRSCWGRATGMLRPGKRR